MNETVYAVVDAGGDYLTADGGRTPASDEAQEFDSREEAQEACDRGTDRVVSWETE